MPPEPQPQNPTNPRSPLHPVGDTEVTEGINQGKRRNLQFGDYKWRVLDVHGDKALIITEDIIEQRRYNEECAEVTWETCTLRKYLNGEFYNKFDSGCKEKILPVTVTNQDNPEYCTKGCRNTNDNIFLLSIDEVNKYFNRASDRMLSYAGMACWWWLRLPGDFSDLAAYVSVGGRVGVSGYYVNYGSGGVRPALWLNLKPFN